MPSASASPSSPTAQFALILLGGFLMTCTVGPVSAIVIDVIHPGVRATGASVLALFQNLFGLAAGPFIAGVAVRRLVGLDDRRWPIMPAFGIVAVGRHADGVRRSYAADIEDAAPREPRRHSPIPPPRRCA